MAKSTDQTRVGVVRWFNAQKGYGFVTPDEGGADVFVHISAVQRSGLETLNEGDLVSFEIIKDKRTGKSAADNLRMRRPSSATAEPILADFEPQRSTATTFRVDEESGTIAPEIAPGGTYTRDREARDRYSELSRLLVALVNTYDSSMPGANSTKFVLDDARLLQEALGETIDDVRVGLLIPRGEVLRQIGQQQSTRDADSDVPALGDTVVRALQGAIAAYNHFVQLDPELARRDNALLDPDESFSSITPETGLAVARGLVASGIVTDLTVMVLETEARVAPKIPNAANRNSRRFSETVLNLVRSVVSRSVEFVNSTKKGLVKVAGTAIALVTLSYGCGNWVLNNEVWLKGAFQGNPPMVQVIESLVEALKKLPLA